MFKFSNIWESLLIRYLKYFGSVWERKLKGLSGCFVSRRLDWIPATVLRVLYCVVHPKKNSFCSNDKKKRSQRLPSVISYICWGIKTGRVGF